MSAETKGFHLFEDDDKKQDPVKVEPKEKKYMFFRISGELFAILLDSAQEVLEQPDCRPIPNTVSYFVGYFNLRGDIVGLIDLSVKFNLASREDSKKRPAILFETSNGNLAVLVDKVEKIAMLKTSEIDFNPKIKTILPQDYLIGISKDSDANAILIDLKKILSEDDWIKIKNK